MNPFTNKSTINFSEHIRNQILCLKVGKAIPLDINGETYTKARVTINKSKGDKVFKTKVNKDTNTLWVMRIK